MTTKYISPGHLYKVAYGRALRDMKRNHEAEFGALMLKHTVEVRREWECASSASIERLRS